MLVSLELKACSINRTPKVDRCEYQLQEISVGWSFILLVLRSLFPPFLLTAVLLHPTRPISPIFHWSSHPSLPLLKFLSLFQQRGLLSAFYCPVLSFSLPWWSSNGWGVQWNGQRLYCAHASLWEDRVRPEVSGNACLCQDTESHSGHVRGVISFRTKGKAGWNELVPQTCPMGWLL